MSGLPREVYEQQRDSVEQACIGANQQLVAQLVAMQLNPVAVADGMTNAFLQGVGILQPSATQAAELCIAAALSYVHHDNGHCSPEVAGTALRELTAKVLARIEASQ